MVYYLMYQQLLEKIGKTQATLSCYHFAKLSC